MSNQTLEKLVWVLIYAGLLLVCLGIFARRSQPVFGWALIAGGGLAAVVGAYLIHLRSTRQ